MSEENVREKERYGAREREEVVIKGADIKAGQEVIRQIVEDRK